MPDLEHGSPCRRVEKKEVAGRILSRRRRPSLETPLLTVNFRQPSHEFTFNVGIDLLF
jgi:hypothetical protein